MPHDLPQFLPAGDSAIQVQLGDGISPEVNRRVHALDRSLRDTPIPGVLDLVPAYRSLLVLFDPVIIAADLLKSSILDRAATLDANLAVRGRVVRVPACYGGPFGPDLGFVASHAGLTADEVVQIHAGGRYLVYMMGFSPGFTYLGGLSPRIAAPRLETPRTAIPAGSVGIAGQQTGIYPVESPGGWRLIGRTPIPLFNAARVPPTAVDPGDWLEFVPVDERTYAAIDEEVKAGTYSVEAELLD